MRRWPVHHAPIQSPGPRERHRLTADSLPHVVAVNTLSAYILTALIERPRRLVHFSSGMHHGTDANLGDILWEKRCWKGTQAYAESKLHDAMLAFAAAPRWPGVFSNALEPGWVSTRMGGGAPDDMAQVHLTQAWLAAGNDPAADLTGTYLYHMRPKAPNPQAHDAALQDSLLAACARHSGITWPVCPLVMSRYADA